MKLKTKYYLIPMLFISLGFIRCSTNSQDQTSKVVKNQESKAAQSNINPGKDWLDINSVAINAHGGSVFYEGGFYHWYGAHKLPGVSENSGLSVGGIHCYRSRDLINWNDFGIVMPVDRKNKKSDIAFGNRIERPHVVFNKKTKKYVCIFKLFIGAGLKVGYHGVATSDKPTGPFVYKSKFIAASSTVGSGDFTIYKDANEGLHLIAVRKTDRAMVIGQMNENYLAPKTEFQVMPNITISTEAPCVFYKSGTYHLLGSGSTGWNPNPARYFTTTDLYGSWTNQGNPCSGINPILNLGPAKTFGGQPTDIIQIQGVENQYIAMMDIWRPSEPIKGGYIWLPFRVSNKKLSIKWNDSWNLNWFNNN
jgi:hypothetical protein